MSDNPTFRVYASETSQFLAPYESSMKSRSSDSPVQEVTARGPMVPPGVSASTADVNHPIAPDSRSLSADVADWNPFEEPPFSQMTEDHIFGEEFDKIRRGSQSSEYNDVVTKTTHIFSTIDFHLKFCFFRRYSRCQV